LRAAWTSVDSPAGVAAVWMAGAGLVVALLTAVVALAVAYGRRGRATRLLLGALLPVAFGLFMVGEWADVKVLKPIGVGLLLVAIALFWVGRLVGKVPVAPNALTDPNYSLTKPWTYQVAKLPGDPSAEGGDSNQPTTDDEPDEPAPVMVVSDWSATLVALLVVPGVFVSWLALALGQVWFFLAGVVVSLTVPWWVSRGMRRRRLAGTRYEGQATALSTGETALVFVLLVVFTAGGFLLAGSSLADAELLNHRIDGDLFVGVLTAGFGVMWIVISAFCVPLFGRRESAEGTTRVWLSWGVYLLTVVLLFVAGDGWPVTGSSRQGWGLFAMLNAVITVMVWQLRRVRPAQTATDEAWRRTGTVGPSRRGSDERQ
jgi:hypothetical protein